MHNFKNIIIMARLKIDEAIARAMLNGKKMKKIEIAARLWPDSSNPTRRQNMANLCTGKTKQITTEMVAIICEMTGVDANFLLGV